MIAGSAISSACVPSFVPQVEGKKKEKKRGLPGVVMPKIRCPVIYQKEYSSPGCLIIMINNNINDLIYLTSTFYNVCYSSIIMLICLRAHLHYLRSFLYLFLLDVSVFFTVANIVFFLTITYMITTDLIYLSPITYLKESVVLVEEKVPASTTQSFLFIY